MLISSAIVLNLGVCGLILRPFQESSELPLMCVQGRYVLLFSYVYVCPDYYYVMSSCGPV